MVASSFSRQSHQCFTATVVPTEIAESRIHKRLSQLIEALIEDTEIGSERQLGRITALSGNALGNWSDLKADPRLLKLIQFAYSLGWSMTELMSFAEGNEAPKTAIARKKRASAISKISDNKRASRK